MENGGGEAGDAAAAAAVGTVAVAREEEQPSSAGAAVDAATAADAAAAAEQMLTPRSETAELMVTPRSEMADIGAPDATTPVARGGSDFGKGYYGDEADIFEEAVQQEDDVAAAAATPRGVDDDDVAVDGDGAYGDGQRVRDEDGREHAHDPPPPPVSIGADENGVSHEMPYETSPAFQVGGEQAPEAGLAGTAVVNDSAVAPNSGEVIGGGYDQGPGPDKSVQHADDASVVVDNGGSGAVVDKEERQQQQEVASVPVGAPPEVIECHDSDMQLDEGGEEAHQNGKYEPENAGGPHHQHDGTLDNGLTDGDGEVLPPPQPASPRVSEQLIPPNQEDRVWSPLEDPSVKLAETGSDTQRMMADDDYPEEDQERDEVVATREPADVLSELSESPPPKSDTPTVENSSESVHEDDKDEDEDEAESSLQPPPLPLPAAAVPSAEPKASATSQSHPSGLGTSAPLPAEPAARAVPQQPRVNGSVPRRQAQPSEDAAANGEVEEYDETREKLQMIRVKFLRLAYRLGQTPHNVVVAQVLYRLGLAEQLSGSMNTSRAGAFSFDRASAMAEQLEAAGQEPLDFSCTIMVIGKTGVGKSATINSIFDEVRLKTDAFQLGTKEVQEIVGTVQGIKVRVIDTPGLLPSLKDQMRNEKILRSVKKFIKKNPPDVIMYLDRLDMQNRDLGDVPLLRTITNTFGPSIWFNAIVVLTHAASAPPEGANGTPLSYEMYVTQRTHVIQNAIRQAAGDPRLLNPVSLVENHSACRMNRAGQRVLPNGQVWKPHLLLLSFASKILTEANLLLKLQDVPAGRPGGSRHRSPPLPFFLSSLLQSRPQVKLPDEQFGEDDPTDMDVDEESESDEESDYDSLPPFKRLTNEQLSRLSKTQRKAYFEEMDYRERLYFKKQLKEERKRKKLLKKMTEEAVNFPDEYSNDGIVDENSAPATVPVPVPDMALPASFDPDYPSHRYRFLDSPSQWIVRPVLETQGWDHDVGYEGVNAERLFVVRDKIPVSVSGQLTKDKKECTLQMEMASSIKHGEGKVSSLGLDLQSIGKDIAYTLRGETRFPNFRRNSTAAAITATLLGDTLSAGLKIEDKLTLGKRFKMLVSGGAMSGRGDVAYGGRLEATLRDKDYPLGRQLSTLALSVVDWHGDLAVGCNLQSQIPVGRGTNMTAHASLNNRGTGQIGVRVNSSEQLLLAMAALAPLLSNAIKYISGSSESI